MKILIMQRVDLLIYFNSVIIEFTFDMVNTRINL